MNRALAAGAVLLAFASTPASAAHWNVDYAKSRLGFAVQWSNEPFVAVFKSWKADIEFDPTDLAHARAVVTIDLNSEASDSPDNDDGLKGAMGFQVSQFPQARFETVKFSHVDANNYIALGKLTIRGMSKMVTLRFTLNSKGNATQMLGKAITYRTDYGLGQGEWADEKIIAHLVTVNIDLTANKAR